MAARNRVIRRAAAAHVVSEADAKAAMAQAAPHGRREFPALAPHLSERLIAAVPNEPAIATTIDGKLQQAAEQITRRNAELFGEKLSIAALIVDNRTGEVLAHVGSAGYFDDTRLGAIDMTAAIRSPGSALKPFIYGIAFEDGLAHPETLIEDRPVRFDTYAPVNFDNSFHGTVTVRAALQLSLNVPAVKILNEVSPVKLAGRFRDAGMPFEVPRNLTVALGGVGLSLENLTGLYVALARGGSVIPLRYRKDGAAAALAQRMRPFCCSRLRRGMSPTSCAGRPFRPARRRAPWRSRPARPTVSATPGPPVTTATIRLPFGLAAPTQAPCPDLWDCAPRLPSCSSFSPPSGRAARPSLPRRQT